MLLVAGAAGVADEEDGREVGAGGDEDRPGQQRQRREPAREGVAVALGGHVAGGDRADHGAHEERGQHRGEGEGGAQRPPRPGSDSIDLRKAKPAPRRTIPTAASAIGT